MLVGCSKNQKELDRLLNKATYLRKKVMAAFPDCSAEELNRERETRVRITEKVMQLTNARIALFNKTIPEIVLAEVPV